MSSGKGWAWAGFLLGTGVSIGGNIAHTFYPSADVLATAGVSARDWHPTIGAQAVAAFFPLALLVTVEILARAPWPSGWGWATARFGGAALVASVAAVVSYLHLYGLLLAYGESPITTTIGPLAVDGLMVVSGFALLAISHAERGAQIVSTPAGTPTDSPVPVAEEEPVPAPGIRHAGTGFETVPGPQVRVPRPYPQSVPEPRMQPDGRSPWRSFDGPSDGSAAVESVAAETDFAAAQNGHTRTERAGIAAAPEEDSDEWVRLLGLYPEGVPGDLDADGFRHPMAAPETQPDAVEADVPDHEVGVPGAYPDAVPADRARPARGPANGTVTTPDREYSGEPEVRVPEMYLDPDPHQVQAVTVFAAELGDGEVPSLRRIKTTLKIGQPKAEQVRDYLRRLVDAQPADGERVGADAG